jgi:hypothetical protein
VVQTGTENLSLAVFENRPDSRQKQILFGKYKRNISDKIFDLSYRYSTDDWGIDSHTFDVSLRYPLSKGWLKPKLRLYSQSAADFYTPFFLNGDQPVAADTSQFATADYRLGELNTYTLGLEYGRDGKQNWRVSLEYYLQQSTEPEKFGSLDAFTLAPDVDAVMVRFGSSF